MPNPVDPREAMVELGRLIYQRQLSDSAGGNVSVRAGGKIYITPAFMGSRHRWSITPGMISVLDAESHALLEGPATISRESKAHLALYRTFPEAGAVIHAHPYHVQVFACANRALAPATEYTDKFGAIPCVSPAKAHSQDLADAVAETMAVQREGFRSHGLAVLLPRHGIIVMGHDLDEAYDVLERAEVNARVTLLSVLLPPEGACE